MEDGVKREDAQKGVWELVGVVPDFCMSRNETGGEIVAYRKRNKEGGSACLGGAGAGEFEGRGRARGPAGSEVEDGVQAARFPQVGTLPCVQVGYRWLADVSSLCLWSLGTCVGAISQLSLVSRVESSREQPQSFLANSLRIGRLSRRAGLEARPLHLYCVAGRRVGYAGGR